MKRITFFAIAALAFGGGAFAETRVSVTAELFNAISSGAELESWTYLPAGSAELSVLNRGSRLVRSEILLRFTPMGSTLRTDLERLYVRAAFGETLVTVGKTRSSWGSGLAFNAGDIIFGSSSVDFSLQDSDPRSQTWWLTSAEIPISGFSFIELIVLPGEIDLSNPVAPVPPALDETSAGGRVNVAFGNATAQAGYLYRGAQIAGLGTRGHHAFVSIEGYAPVNWHLSASSRTRVESWDTDVITDALTVTAGAFGDVSLQADRSLGWQIEVLGRPFGSLEAETDVSDPADYALFLYPGMSFVPRPGLVLSLSSLVGPIDLSARSALAVSWNIYESLTLLGSVSVAAGEDDDVFLLNGVGGVSFALGARYVY